MEDNVKMEMVAEPQKSVAEEFQGVEAEVFSSLNPESKDDKITVFNAMQSTDFSLNDCVGKVIEVKDFIAHDQEMNDMNTGEHIHRTRCILIDKDGKTYSTVSPSFKNAIKKIFSIFGNPTTWDKPLKIEIVKKKGTGAYSFLTCKVAK